MEQAVRAWLEGRAGGRMGRAARVLLAPLGRVYGHFALRRRRAYAEGRRAVYRASVPVVSVGNLVAGGVGKTPFVLQLVRWATDAGARPAVLLRGYGARRPDEADEPAMIRAACPGVAVYVDPDRVASSKRAVEDGCDLLILDDGFQHGRLARDVDFVLVDATCPWGGGRCFPAGLLREPWSALASATAVVLTRADQAGPEAVADIRARLRADFPALPITTASHAPARWTDLDGRPLGGGLGALRGCRVVAACGIGQPEAFRRTLLDAGATVTRLFPFPDHHAYTRREVQALRLAAATDAARLAFTEKDAVKVRQWVEAPDRGAVGVLGVDFAVVDEEETRARVLALLGPSARGATPEP